MIFGISRRYVKSWILEDKRYVLLPNFTKNGYFLWLQIIWVTQRHKIYVPKQPTMGYIEK
jgi:hypothetical protein